ncbi:hypothetical protein [Acetobacterium sp.]|uniref:hypothetical protein n=1 Tax=Acetobacterium sp. TaxID=1872094 RepID=UPI002F421799
MGILFFVVVGIIAFIIFNLFSSRKVSQNSRQRLINGFGKTPTSFDPAIWGSVTDYWDRKLKYETIDVVIDDLTWSDLDMDDVFKQMNTCLTSVGDEVLYATLHEPKWEDEPLRKRDQLITFFEDNPKERLEIQMILAKLGKANYNDVSALIFGIEMKALKNPMVYSILSIIPFLCIGICLIDPTIGLMSLIISIIVNGGIYYYFKKEITKNLLTIEYLSAILRCCNRLLSYETKGSLKVIVDQIGQDNVPLKPLPVNSRASFLCSY